MNHYQAGTYSGQPINGSDIVHPAGCQYWPMRLVGGWAPGDPPVFGGVRLLSGDGAHPVYPADSRLMQHWLTTSAFDVTVAFSESSANLPSIFQSFTQNVGTTAVISEDGASVSGHTDSAATKDDLLLGQVETRITWDGRDDDGTYDYAGTFDVRIRHGQWAWHTDHEVWMMGLTGSVSVYKYELSPTVPSRHQGDSGTIGTCPMGTVWDEGPVAELGEDLYEWACVPIGGSSATVGRSVNPDGSDFMGSFLGRLIRAEEITVENGTTAPGLSFSVSITQSTAYTY